MLKLSEKQIIGEMKSHDHGPPTRILEKGVWKIINKNMIKEDFRNSNPSAKNENIDKIIEKVTLSKVALKRIRTVEVQTKEVRMGGSQAVEVQTFKIQTMEVQTMTPIQKVNSVDIQTVHVQTVESEVQTMEAEIEPELVSLGVGYNMFTEIPPPLVSTKHQSAIEVSKDYPTETISYKEDAPAVQEGLQVRNQSSQNNHPIIYYESNGIQISQLTQPTEIQPADNIAQLNIEDYRKSSAQYGPVMHTTSINQCPKHHNAPKRFLCKKEGCNKIHIAKNDAVPSLNVIQPQSVAQHVSVYQTKPVTQTSTDINSTTAGEPVLTYYKTAHQPVAQTKYVNLVYLQTEKGPQILALPQPAPSPKSNQFSTSANVTQTRYQGNVAQQSTMLIDLSSSLVQPSVENQLDSNVQPFLSIDDQPSTSFVIVAKPKITTDGQSFSKKTQVDQATVLNMANDSTSNIHQSSKVMNPSLLAQLSSSMVSQFFTSLEDIPLPTPNIDVDPSTALEVNQPSDLVIDQPSSSAANNTSTSEVEQSSFSTVEQPTTIESPTISTVKQPLDVEHAGSVVDIISIANDDLPSNVKVKQPKVKYPFTSKVDESSSEDYVPPEPAVKKPKVAKRISKPRKSKYRAELLLKTYISDLSDDD